MEMESKNLKSNADKARAAAMLGQILRRVEVPHEQAATSAHHELQHALGDKGGVGKIGVSAYGGGYRAYYSTIGPRTDEQRLRIVEAATDGYSSTDVEMAKKLREKIERRKRNILVRIFGL